HYMTLNKAAGGIGRTLAMALLVAGSLAGCAANAPQYYSLQAAPASAGTGGASATVPGDYAISVQPVLVPEQVARPQIVVGQPFGSEVVPLNAALWASPLEAQIRNAIAAELTQRLGVLDVGAATAADGMPVWRIYLDVQRFDSLYDVAVQHDVVWRLVPQGMPRNVGQRVCSASVRRDVGTGMSALIEGHRAALASLAAAIAQSIPGGKQSTTTPALKGGAAARGNIPSASAQ